MGKDKKTNRPSRRGPAAPLAAPTAPPDYDSETPKFCLRYLQPGFDVNALADDGRAAFAIALAKRAQMTWREITLADRHGLGSEFIPARQIKPAIPEAFQDSERFLVLRYHAKLPMAGVRVRDVLHLLWIEPRFNDLYPHG